MTDAPLDMIGVDALERPHAALPRSARRRRPSRPSSPIFARTLAHIDRMPDEADTSFRSLTTAMAAGDAAAVEAFYRRWFEPMLAMARQAVPARRRDEAFALDVVQDAMLRIVRCIRPMDDEAHVTNWTRLVVQSCALDRLRKDGRRQRRETIRVAESDAGSASDLDEEAEWLSREIATLEPTLAALLRRRFDDGWTLARIAAALQTTTGQVDGRLRRAIATLRDRARKAFDA